jgi:hypothetical protein
MGHALNAAIGPHPVVAEFTGRWHLARPVPLRQGFAMVPLTEALHDDIAGRAGLDGPDPFEEFVYLALGVVAAVREAAEAGTLAYIETEYFGGLGSQAAVGWLDRGRVLVGPFRTETTWDGRRAVHHPPGEWAINRVLATLGVPTTRRAGRVAWKHWMSRVLATLGIPTLGTLDQFDMLGLGTYRDTEEAAERSG